ncbi:hypothetical protein [Allomesorhizobium alhagi]|nr:hypothetical protein [Mesorhizobium alhagi]
MKTALKPFNTRQRHFKDGDVVRPADDLRPFTFADLLARGFVGDNKPEPKPSKGKAAG